MMIAGDYLGLQVKPWLAQRQYTEDKN